MPANDAETPLRDEARHQPELDGIRGLAILLVLVSHGATGLGLMTFLRPHMVWAGLVRLVMIPGWGGVDLFFVLSGFLITGILLRTKEQPQYFLSFYARRALRIFPIYYLALLGSMLAVHFAPELGGNLPAPGLARAVYFFYLQNVPLFWANPVAMTGWWGVYWSLAAEEQFYFVWPWLVKVLSPAVLLRVCVAGFALGLPIRLILAHRYFGLHVGLIQFTPARAGGLLAGAAIALFTTLKRRLVPLPWIVAAALCGTVILMSVFLLHPVDMVGDGRLYTVGITAFALLSAALLAWSQHHPPRLQRLLYARGLRNAGKYSYGMYVYHPFVYAAVRGLARSPALTKDGEFSLVTALGIVMLAIALTWLLAKLSFDFFEKRFLRLKHRFPATGG